MITRYSYYNDRGLVYEGNFKEMDSKDINIGDWILTHHVCRFCNVPIMQKVFDKKLAMYFQNEEIYDFIVEGGSSYKSNLKHISLYDQLDRNIDFTDKFK